MALALAGCVLHHRITGVLLRGVVPRKACLPSTLDYLFFRFTRGTDSSSNTGTIFNLLLLLWYVPPRDTPYCTVPIGQQQKAPVEKMSEGVAMYAPAFESSPLREGVSFDEGPLLVARHGINNNTGDGVAAVGDRRGEDEDDSVALVFSADTGAGRAHTPQRLNRTGTPQRWVVPSSTWRKDGIVSSSTVECFRSNACHVRICACFRSKRP